MYAQKEQQNNACGRFCASWWRVFFLMLFSFLVIFSIYLSVNFVNHYYLLWKWPLMGGNMLAINICSQKVSNHWFCVTMIHPNQLPLVRHLNPVVGPRKNLQRFGLAWTKFSNNTPSRPLAIRNDPSGEGEGRLYWGQWSLGGSRKIEDRGELITQTDI